MCLGDELLHHSDRALMSAFCKNTSIIELWHTMIDYETSRRIAPIFRRNQHLWHVHGLLRPATTAMATTATATTPSLLLLHQPSCGLWPRALAMVGQDSHGSTPVFEVLRDRLACWIKLDDNVRKELQKG
jgi:hypothetical protein